MLLSTYPQCRLALFSGLFSQHRQWAHTSRLLLLSRVSSLSCSTMSAPISTSGSPTLGAQGLPFPDYLEGRDEDNKKDRIAIAAFRIYKNGRLSHQPCRLVRVFPAKISYQTSQSTRICFSKHTKFLVSYSVSEKAKTVLWTRAYRLDAPGVRSSQ